MTNNSELIAITRHRLTVQSQVVAKTKGLGTASILHRENIVLEDYFKSVIKALQSTPSPAKINSDAAELVDQMIKSVVIHSHSMEHSSTEDIEDASAACREAKKKLLTFIQSSGNSVQRGEPTRIKGFNPNAIVQREAPGQPAPNSVQVQGDAGKHIENLQEMIKAVNDSGEWWMDCPDRGGLDMDKMESLLAFIQNQPAAPTSPYVPKSEVMVRMADIDKLIKTLDENDHHDVARSFGRLIHLAVEAHPLPNSDKPEQGESE